MEKLGVLGGIEAKNTFKATIKNVRAVIDIGTNSVKLCVAKGGHASGEYFVIRDEIKITRLGEGLRESNEILPLPSERSIETIRRFAACAREFGASEIRAVGTAALRIAANADAFCKEVKDKCGIDIEIIAGEREAQLSHSAAAVFARGRDCFIFDIGGGSTELIYSKNDDRQSLNRLSLDLGVLKIREKYFISEPTETDSIIKADIEIADILHKGGLTAPKPPFSLIGIGGTVTAMASVKLKLLKYLPSKVSGTILNRSDIEAQIQQYQNSTSEERARIPGLDADRADIILSGACIVKVIMDSLSAGELTVSANGIRHALLTEMFKQ